MMSDPKKLRFYRLIHLLWLFPFYLVVLSFHQLSVYRGMVQTAELGETITANVLDAKIKRIASQANGWVIVSFQDEKQVMHEEKLGLPVNIASKLMLDPTLEISYYKSSFMPIVIMKTFDVHKNVVLINLAIALIGTIALLIVMFIASRFAERKIRLAGSDELQIIRVD